MSTETWVLNEALAESDGLSSTINFTSNGGNFELFEVQARNVNLIYHYSKTTADYISPYDSSSGWSAELYRTISFEIAPTGDLLTWLQANGTKQETSNITTKINIKIIDIGSYSENGFSQKLTRAFLGSKNHLYSIEDITDGIVSGTTLSFTIEKGADLTEEWGLWLDGGAEHYTVNNIDSIELAKSSSFINVHDGRWWHGKIETTGDSTIIEVSCTPACSGLNILASNIPKEAKYFTVGSPQFWPTEFNALTGKPADSQTGVINKCTLPYKATVLTDNHLNFTYLFLQAYDEEGNLLKQTEPIITAPSSQGVCQIIDMLPIELSISNISNKTIIDQIFEKIDETSFYNFLDNVISMTTIENYLDILKTENKAEYIFSMFLLYEEILTITELFKLKEDLKNYPEDYFNIIKIMVCLELQIFTPETKLNSQDNYKFLYNNKVYVRNMVRNVYYGGYTNNQRLEYKDLENLTNEISLNSDNFNTYLRLNDSDEVKIGETVYSNALTNGIYKISKDLNKECGYHFEYIEHFINEIYSLDNLDVEFNEDSIKLIQEDIFSKII